MSTHKPSANTQAASTPSSTEIRLAAKKGESHAELVARFAIDGALINAFTLTNYGRGSLGNLDLAACLGAVEGRAKRIVDGDLSPLETTLTAQAAVLDAMFNEFARRAALNMGEYMQATDTYARLAMKAQAQCRATIETIAEIKQPRAVAFVKQANIAHGHQQVNNGVPPTRTENGITRTNELLEADHEQRLDTTTAGTPTGVDTAMATLGALDGTAHR